MFIAEKTKILQEDIGKLKKKNANLRAVADSNEGYEMNILVKFKVKRATEKIQ